MGRVYTSYGRYREALPYFIKIMEIEEKVFGDNHIDTASSYHELAVIYRFLAKTKESEIFFKKAINIREK